MTDNEEVPGGGPAGWNLTRPGIICGSGAGRIMLLETTFKATTRTPH